MFGLPYFLPRSSPLTMILGSPIPVPKIADASKEVQEKYHQQLLDAMERIFEENKADFGMADYKLRIL